MLPNYEVFKQEIAQFILQYLQQENFPLIEFDFIYNNISTPPDFAFGQAAFPCFSLTKFFKQPPNAIAQKIATYIDSHKKTYIDTVTVVNAYLNFTCQFETLLDFNLNRNFDKNSLTPKNIDQLS